MSQQTFWIWPALFGITAAFIAIGIAITLFGARPALVRQKSKIGSLIFLLNGMMGTCNGAPETDAGCHDFTLLEQ